MVYNFLGEFFSTFLLLLLGIGLCIRDSKLTRIKISSYWGLGIYIGSIVGSWFGSSKMNIVFLLLDFMNEKISFIIFLIKLIGEIFGAIFATLIILKNSRKINTEINDFAALASINSNSKAFILEAVSTFSMIVTSNLLDSFIYPTLKPIMMSLYMSLLIFWLCPITGASFNPIRDFVPRVTFVFWENNYNNFHRSILSSNVAPLLSTFVYIVLKQHFRS